MLQADADDNREVVDFLSFKVIGLERHIAYIDLGSARYCFENIFDALSCCFQMYFVLDINYPEGTAHLWDFINIAFFNIETKNVAPFAFTLLSDLNANDE